MNFEEDNRPPVKKANIGWRKISLRTRITVLLLLGMSIYISVQLVANVSLAERRVVIRYWNSFVCLFLSIAVPHLLFPDAELYLIQTINLTRKRLLKHQFRKLGIALSAIGLPAIILVFYDLDNVRQNIFEGMILLFESWLFLIGIGCHAFQKFVSIGQRSQDWREGKRGKLCRRLVKIKAERIPTMMATVNIAFWGMHLIVLGAYLSHVCRFDFEWLSGTLLLSWAAVRMSFKVKDYDRHFYGANAFYAEAFKDNISVPNGKQDEAITYASLYWVPQRWRPHVWTGLVQIDRILPLAVFMALGHLFLWLLFYLKTSNSFIMTYLLLLLVSKNGMSYLLITPSAAPVHFQVMLQSSMNWIMTRFLINLRWTFLLVISLMLVAWIWDSFNFSQAGNWIALDLSLAFLSALLFTYLHEGQLKKRYV